MKRTALLLILLSLVVLGFAAPDAMAVQSPEPTPPPGPTPRPTPTIKACHICEEDVIPLETPTPPAVVHVLFFYDRLCRECVVVQEEVLPRLQEKYGPQLIIDQVDVEGSAANYQLLRALEQEHEGANGEMPAVFVGQDALNGEEAIRERLPGLIEHYLAQGGTDLPEVTPSPPAAAADAQDRPSVHLAYFYQPGCRECDRVRLDLNYLQHRYPQLVVHELDVKAEAALAEWLAERAGVPQEKRLTAPAVFVGDEGLVGEELHTHSLEALIDRHADAGAEAVWEEPGTAATQAAANIVQRFESLGVATIVMAGLIDGLNPCAFATLVFFISYLAFAGRWGWEVLAAGAAFTLGVFLTYLGVGVGLSRFLASLPFLSAISRWVYGLTAVLCLLLAAGSLHDWWLARHGKPGAIRLKLPSRLRRRINRFIREGTRRRAFIPVTFVAGAAISLLELACTGQVYLPTVLFVMSVPGLRARAGLYLVLYNLMFVLPLVVVFFISYLGTTSQQLGLFIQRRTATVKLATAGLFLLLATWLVVAMR
jgi:cytochrome c biogenesis protein CcdA